MLIQKSERFSENCIMLDGCGVREYSVTRLTLIISLLAHAFILLFAPAAWLKSEQPPVQAPDQTYKINLIAMKTNAPPAVTDTLKTTSPVMPEPVPPKNIQAAAVPLPRPQAAPAAESEKPPVAGEQKTGAADNSSIGLLPQAETPSQIETPLLAEIRQADLSGFIAAFTKRLEEKKEYPYIARKRGQAGTVTLKIKLTAEGELADARVIKSSGFARLDEAAVKLVADVCPVVHGTGRSLVITVPITYNFKEL